MKSRAVAELAGEHSRSRGLAETGTRPAAPPYFFLSYARSADDGALRAFFAELSDEIRTWTGERAQPVGFMDRASLRAGEYWPDEVADALCRCQVFLPVCSPAYAASRVCGQEWAVFQRRLAAYEAATGRRPPSLIPLLWLPGEVPPEVASIQYDDERFGPAYRRYGLRHLLRIGAHRDDRLLFIQELARRVVTVAREYPLVRLRPRPALHTVPSAFH
ncbi:MAG TPA: TIR-like protein FxsC, partial [Rugosimonospora sp.]|nr:TIR-like protein FxsC [Rugosimonospora sp.]